VITASPVTCFGYADGRVFGAGTVEARDVTQRASRPWKTRNITTGSS